MERVTMAGPRRLLDHRHGLAHMLVVLAGEIQEDGVVYRPGAIRISTPADRHFLTVARRARCLIVEGGAVPQVACGSRRVVWLPQLAARLAAARDARQVAELLRLSEVADPAGSGPPSWLVEFEQVRLGGHLVARGIGAAARQAGVSREHLARSYRRHFGNSVTAAIKATRLHVAWDAVTGDSRPLVEVADTCGFADQSHMTRHFAAWIGLTPAAARAASHEVTRLQDGSLAMGF